MKVEIFFQSSGKIVCYLILTVNDYLFLYRIYFLIKPLREIFCLAM